MGRADLNATRGALSLVLLCFMLPFFTFTLSSCGGTDASQAVQVTGIELLRHEHGPIENRTGHAPPPGRMREVPRAAESGQGNAIAVVVLVGLGFLATLAPRRVRPWLVVPAAAGVVWALFVLAGAVDTFGVDVGYEPGFVFAVALGMAATAFAALTAYRDRPAVADPALARPGGFWIRSAGWLLDAIVVGAAAAVALSAVDHATRGAVPAIVTILAVVLVYRVATECSALHGTLGQRITALEVTRADGQPVGIARSAIRAVCDLLCLMFLFGVAHAVSGMTPGKRALHDVLSGTRVGRRAPQPAAAEAPAEAAPAGV
jgi:uncharacterized RDD family membrane protein YckC